MDVYRSIYIICISLLISCSATDTTLLSGIEKDNFDITTRPQDDFYRYVNGTWLDNTKIPDDQSTYGSFNALRDKARDDIRVIIEETANLKDSVKGSNSQKVGDLYNSFMDVEELELLGISPIEPDLKKIDTINDYDSLTIYFARTQKTAADSPYGFYVSNDSKNPTEYISYLSQSGLGLPEKAYYLKEDDKSKALRSEYVSHIEKMFSLFEFKDAKLIASKVMSVETSIAEIHWTMVDRRDRDKTYNKLSVAELENLFPLFTNCLSKVFSALHTMDSCGCCLFRSLELIKYIRPIIPKNPKSHVYGIWIFFKLFPFKIIIIGQAALRMIFSL